MKLVIVDDEETNINIMLHSLQDYKTFAFTDPRKALQFCKDNEFDLILTDMRMPGLNGIELIKEIKTKKVDFVAIVLSAYTDVDYLIEAVNANLLYHYLLKPCDSLLLQETVAQSLKTLQQARSKHEEELRLSTQTRKLTEENTRLKFQANSPLESIIGLHPTILKLKEQVRTFALSDHPVLITGEEGTGKGLISHVIHEMSSRKDKNYVTFSCLTVPEDLHEKELFGSTSNDEQESKTGFLEAAKDGTLYIEDIQELSHSLQSKLLKFLQYSTFYPYGSTEEKKVDTRIICSSRIPLIKRVEEGQFRKELFYKMANLQLKVPPLRERCEDILVIMESIARTMNRPLPSFGQKERDLLTQYAYPGNIRELEGIIEKISLLVKNSKNQSITATDIKTILEENVRIYANDQGSQSVIKTVQLPTGKGNVDLREFIGNIEKTIILDTLYYCDNNMSEAARNLMISRQGLKNKVKRYGLPLEDDEDMA